jgi:hypothetical protein
MRILLISNRVLFFLSFFLPFILLPHCEGPSAEEKMAKEMAMQDSIRMTDSAYYVYQSPAFVMSIPIVKLDSTKNISNLSVHNEPSLIFKKNHNVLTKVHDFLQFPTDNSISGYGIASISFNRNISGIISYVLLFSFLLSIAGIIMLFVRKHHILQIIISGLSLLFLVIFFFHCFY